MTPTRTKVFPPVRKLRIALTIGSSGAAARDGGGVSGACAAGACAYDLPCSGSTTSSKSRQGSPDGVKGRLGAGSSVAGGDSGSLTGSAGRAGGRRRSADNRSSSEISESSCARRIPSFAPITAPNNRRQVTKKGGLPAFRGNWASPKNKPGGAGGTRYDPRS